MYLAPHSPTNDQLIDCINHKLLTAKLDVDGLPIPVYNQQTTIYHTEHEE